MPVVDAGRPGLKARMKMTRKKATGFGKRGREQAEPSVPKVTAVQRLKTLGARWLQTSGLQRKKAHGAKSAFKPSRQRP